MRRLRSVRSFGSHPICGIFARAARSAALMKFRFTGTIPGRRSGARWSFYRSLKVFMGPLRHDTNIAVSVTDLVKRYKKGPEANRGIDFTARNGEVIAILGPNGAGKTTFLRQLTTELMPTSGKIEVFGVDVVAEPQKAKLLMGITPQESGFFETLTVKQHLELFGKLKGLKTDESRTQTA